ncbi:hypothetical protein [Enterobacter roggenkampii]|uniref:hypothetical protein n=1 Tax=Enterobacter roggenkampii TaxID=1812935 RepID=UPI001FD82EAA|nr:hypothetical protein [Enterobacter roggenkampii]
MREVLAALRNNPGLNSVKLAELISMDTRKISDGEHAAGRRLISCEGNTASACTG